MKTTFVDRANTNQKVYETAYQVLQTENEKRPDSKRKKEKHMKKQVRPVSEMVEEKKMSLLGHIIRQKFDHPTYQVTFATPADTTATTPLVIKTSRGIRRRGRPRLNWVFENMQKAWQRINNNEEDDLPLNVAGKPYDNQNADMNKIIYQRAKKRVTPFEGMKQKQKNPANLTCRNSTSQPRSAEDRRVEHDKWLYGDNYESLVNRGVLRGHQGN